ncbi:MAG TPA: alpha/beta hydrolase, partial [Burkholderiaceae bacterium]|nr:alpha/beta hydrolase [Burkholderiaceae bacterium]
PQIAVPFKATTPESSSRDEAVLWSLYDNIRCPTLVIRGVNSDLLSPETMHQMARRGPKAQTMEIPGVGHAPTLMLDNEIAVVRDFLLDAAR